MSEHSPYQLWVEADGDADLYLRLMREHGHILPSPLCPICGDGVRHRHEGDRKVTTDILGHALPRAYCGDCDGVGWYEGGKALQTQCERCYGTGWADGKP